MSPRSDSYAVYVKAAWEWTAALLLLVPCAPVILSLAALVKLTSTGPAFYKQARLGRNGRTYDIWKLRSMTHNCEAATGAVWAAAHDPRTTRVGQFLRETHLDELPQLWNVLRGEMSLIGPRPERPEIVARIEHALPQYRVRLQIRPGITGLAQMQLPADSNVDGVRHKLARDLYYVREHGLLLDLRIALSTVFHCLGVASSALSKLLVHSCGPAAPGVAAQPPAVHELHVGPSVPAAARGFRGIRLAGVESSERGAYSPVAVPSAMSALARATGNARQRVRPATIDLADDALPAEEPAVRSRAA